MPKTSRKSADQSAADEAERDRLRTRLLDLTNRCPPSVLAGSHQLATKWKDAAVRARRLAEKETSALQLMRNAEASLAPFYSEG